MRSGKGLLMQWETRSNMGNLAEAMVRFWGLWILSSVEIPASHDGSSAMQNKEHAATNIQLISHLFWTARVKNRSLLLYLSTASWICLIQLLRSSLELVWTSYISGPADEALIRNIPLSSLATSLTMSLWREITEGFWSWGKQSQQIINYFPRKHHTFKRAWFSINWTNSNPGIVRLHIFPRYKKLQALSVQASL